MKRAAFVGAICTFALAGCAGGQKGGIMANAPQTTPVNMPPITITVPNDPAIKPSFMNTGYYNVQFGSNNPACNPAANGNNIFRLFEEDKTQSSFVVHSRHDNCVAGSGVKYKVNYTLTQAPDGYTLTVQPVERTAYQQGLVLSFPIPYFDDAAVRAYLEEPIVWYEFEVNSAFNKDATLANFLRLATKISYNKDSANDLNHRDRFSIEVNGKTVVLDVGVFPYHAGSKVVVRASVPGIETAPNTVDFREAFKLVKARVEAIINA